MNTMRCKTIINDFDTFFLISTNIINQGKGGGGGSKTISRYWRGDPIRKRRDI